MFPPPARRSAGIPYLHPRNTLFKLTAIVRSQMPSSVSTASRSSSCMMPALLNRTSSRPKVRSAVCTIPAHASDFETSARQYIAVPPCSLTSLTVSCPPSSLTSTTTTLAPSAANKMAVARPIPPAPPVINATLFSSRIRLSSPLMSGSPHYADARLRIIQRAEPVQPLQVHRTAAVGQDRRLLLTPGAIAPLPATDGLVFPPPQSCHQVRVRLP